MLIFVTEPGARQKSEVTSVIKKDKWGPVLDLQAASAQDTCLDAFCISSGKGGMHLTKSRHHTYVQPSSLEMGTGQQ